jgi:hypothetical protein
MLGGPSGGGGWDPQGAVSAPRASSTFGQTVAMSGSTFLVGEPGANSGAGVVHVFSSVVAPTPALGDMTPLLVLALSGAGILSMRSRRRAGARERGVRA